ncbi:hypothetical protein Vi05172_g10997 [Venturia inaequalis]|nr:hypothetical protein Vi05172_g10997 [Venturia inaequalis]
MPPTPNPKDPSQNTSSVQSIPIAQSSENRLPPTASPPSAGSNEPLHIPSPSGTFEHTLTDLAPSGTGSPTASNIPSITFNASGNASRAAGVPPTPAPNGPQPGLTSTTLLVSVYTAINGTWLPSVETIAPVTDAGPASPTQTFASSITTNGSIPSPPLATHDPSGTMSGAPGGGGGGIGGLIWSALGGGPGDRAGPLPLATGAASTSHDNSTEGTRTTATILLSTPLSPILGGGGAVAATRTSSPMLAAATGGVTVVRVSFGEVLGLVGSVFVGMSVL